MSTLTFVFCLSFMLVSVACQSCDLPPSLWCSSPEIAKRCNVSDVCKTYLSPATENSKVTVSVYYESRCPFSIKFLLDQVMKAFAKVGDIMTVDLVPFGNSHVRKIGSKVVFTCQHGPTECAANIVETCAVRLLPVKQHLPLIACISYQFIHGVKPASAYKICADKQQIDMKPILACSQSDQGVNFQKDMATRTNRLNPHKSYVPWIVVNGVHTQSINNKARTNLIQLVCDTYKGSDKPAACSKS
ncbi:gamma-interferon-inducible lysosomal thiol reductase [Octopus bimaculoides]|uniref:Uncharacterized protein n=1 Tax=Octopus bimaculoides TaxID=37653 RepID=A0A0L8H1J8_OCTBM|nr:gamma-interferon-inducible lysosomal thiol reductase [Octopus bimaculoides]|eukprot:XP_014776192.1 PREDICTED: gamma-interferon-inducible lysosomal thiol reductase-like [Octopus bimaculoides]